MSAHAEHCLLWLEVNSVPLAWDSVGREANFQGIINQWMKGGQNTFRARLDWPRNVPFAPKTATLVAKVEFFPPEAKVATDGVTVNLTWPQIEREEGYPSIIEDSVQVVGFPTTLAWDKTTIIRDLTDADRTDIGELLFNLHRAYHTGDVEAILALTQPKTQDLATSFGSDPTEDANDAKEFLIGLTGSANWGLLPIEPDAIGLDTVGDGHLVWVYRGDHVPVLQSRPEAKYKWLLPVYVGRLEGRWRVFR